MPPKWYAMDTARLPWSVLQYPIAQLGKKCVILVTTGTDTEVLTLLFFWDSSAVTMQFLHSYTVEVPALVFQGNSRATSNEQHSYFGVGTSAVTVQWGTASPAIVILLTMKLWHWKSRWKSRLTLEILGTNDMSDAENFQCDLIFFSVISVSLNNKEKYFSVIIHVVSFVNIFQCDFRVSSVCKKLSVWFSVS